MLLCRLESASGAATHPLSNRAPLAHLLQARDSVNRGKATGLDRVAPEMIRALPWKALIVIRQTFERRFMGFDTHLVESWLANISILLSKHAKQVTHLQVQTCGICLQNTLAKWYCVCLSNMLETCFSIICLRIWRSEGGVH